VTAWWCLHVILPWRSAGKRIPQERRLGCVLLQVIDCVASHMLMKREKMGREGFDEYIQ